MYLRPHAQTDWPRLCQIHDSARLDELVASGLEAAFLDLASTATNEGLFEGQVIVAEINGEVEGFIAYSDGELTWLYVNPIKQGQGIGRALVRHAVEANEGNLSTEVLAGNEKALQLYTSEGFVVLRRVDGQLSGNEAFAASGYVLECKNHAA